jgi:hypothetical protein
MESGAADVSELCLRLVRRDTGAVRDFRASGSKRPTFAALLNSLWEGPDAVEVTSWRQLGDDVRGPWVIEATSPTHGPHVYDVTFVGKGWWFGQDLRKNMEEVGYEPHGTPTNLTHLLCNAFLAIAEDCSFAAPPDALFDIEPFYEVYGPWIPPCIPWTGDLEDDSLTSIAMRWGIVPKVDSPEARRQIVEYLRAVLEDAPEDLPLRLVCGEPDEYETPGRRDLTRDVVSELAASGCEVEKEPGLWETEIIQIDLLVLLELVSAETVDEDTEEDSDDEIDEDDEQEQEDEVAVEEDSDDENAEEVPDYVDWIVGVPLPAERLAAVITRMAAGEAPEDALFAVTGSRTLPA